MGPMGSAVINPAFVPLGKAFGITPVQASYELTVYLLFTGFGPFVVVPFAHIYGRRPLILVGGLLAAITNIIAGYCTTWAGIMVTRAFNGWGVGTTIALGPPVICDLFFLHERGFYMGIFALFLNNGPHFAPLIGGFIAQNLGWQSCFTIPVSAQRFMTFSCVQHKTKGRERPAMLTHRRFRAIFNSVSG